MRIRHDEETVVANLDIALPWKFLKQLTWFHLVVGSTDVLNNKG